MPGRAPRILAPCDGSRSCSLALLLVGCSLISIDLTPRIRPLEEETVEGKGDAKIFLMDISGFISDETPGGRR